MMVPLKPQVQGKAGVSNYGSNSNSWRGNQDLQSASQTREAGLGILGEALGGALVWATRPVPETILDTAKSLQAQGLV